MVSSASATVMPSGRARISASVICRPRRSADAPSGGVPVVLDEAAKEGRRADALVIIRKHVRRLVSTCGMVSMVST